MSNDKKTEEIERQISNCIDQIVDDLDGDWINNYADSYLSHLCESVGMDPVEAVERLAKELDSARRSLYADLSGSEIVDLLVAKMDDQDIVDRIINIADVVDCSNMRSTHLEIDSARVGEFEYEIDVDDHPELAELIKQLPDDHEDRNRARWAVYGHPCDQLSLVVTADLFLEAVSEQLDEAILESKINDLLDEEQVV